MAGNGPGGLKVGDLYVSVTASIGQAVKTLSDFVDAAEEFADQVEEKLSKAAAALGDISDGFLTAAAVATGSLLAAKEVNQQVKDSLDEVTRATQTLANEMAKDLVPLVKEVTKWIKTAIATYRNLSDEQRALIVSGVKWAFILGTTTKALERSIVFTKGFFEATVAVIQIGKPMASAMATMGAAARSLFPALEKVGWAMVYIKQADHKQVYSDIATKMASIKEAAKTLPATLSTFGKSATGILPQLATIGAPILAVAAAVGALILLVAVLRDTWQKAGDDIKAWFSEVADGAARVASKIGSVIQSVFSALTGFIMKGVKLAFEVLAVQVRWLAKFAKPVARLAGAKEIESLLDTLSRTSADKMMEYMTVGAEFLFQKGEEALGDAANQLGAKSKDIASDLAKGASSIGKTFTDSVSNGIALLKKDLGMDGLFGGASPLPKMGDPSSVTLAQTLEEAEAYEKWLKDLSDLQEDAAAESLKEYQNAVRAEAHEASLMFKEVAKVAAELRAEMQHEIIGVPMELLVGQILEQGERLREAAEEMADRMEDARDAIATKLFGRLGDIGDILESGLQGFQAGGVWGAIIAVVMDLLTRSEGFKAIIDMTNNVLKMITDTLGKFFTPLKPLVAALLQIDLMVSQFLGPILEQIGRSFGSFAPILMLVSEVLSPILGLFGAAVEALVQMLSWITEGSLKLAFEVLKVVGQVIVGIVWGVAELWNLILSILQVVFRKLSELNIAGWKPLEGLSKWADGLEDAKADTDVFREAIDGLNDLTWESAKAKADELAKTYEMQDALDKATESLTNVPSTWKVALGRFEAQDPHNAPGAGSVPGKGSQGVAAAQTAQSTVVNEAPALVIGNVNFNNTPAEANARQLELLAERVAMRKRGSVGSSNLNVYEGN